MTRTGILYSSFMKITIPKREITMRQCIINMSFFCPKYFEGNIERKLEQRLKKLLMFTASIIGILKSPLFFMSKKIVV
jgi:hypothetical protein